MVSSDATGGWRARQEVRTGLMSEAIWKIFEVDELGEQRERLGTPYMEFLRVPNLSCGIYTLAAGSKDLQAPHDDDEVYYVVRGRARMLLDGKEHPVGPGTVLYVAATAEHSFFEIEEELTVLVFFASGGPSEQ